MIFFPLIKMIKQFVYATDITLPKSVIGLLDGSEQFCFENPYFPVAGIPKPDMKQFLEVKGLNSKYGVFLNSISIYYKGANGVFTKQYAIGYTETFNTGTGIDKKKKDYYIMKPFEVNKLGDSYKHKLIISPAKGEILNEDKTLLNLDYQFSMVMDVLCISKMLNINLNKYKGMPNDTFYKSFITDINAFLKNKGSKKEIEYDEALVNSFNDPPIIGKSERGETVPVCILDDGKNVETLFETLFMKFYESILKIKNQFKGWEKVLQRSNCASFPSIKLIDFEKKSSDEEITHIPRFDGRFTFYIQLTKGDKGYSDKIPDGLITRQQVTKQKIDKLTKATLPKLWGGAMSDDDKVKGATQQGCLYVVPQPIFRYYEKGCPTIDWRVEKIATRRIMSASSADYDEGCDFVGDGDEDMEISGGSNSGNYEESNKDNGSFTGNENEIDPDSL